MSVDGLGVVGADVRLSVHHLDNNGDHQSLATNITLLDDGVAGNVSITYTQCIQNISNYTKKYFRS